MMKAKREQKPLKQLIDDLLIRYGLEEKLNEHRLIEVWETLLGKMISRHTTEIRLKRGVLFLQFDSATIRQELSYSNDQLILELNEAMGKEVIKKIVFR
jgi:predicted nucleic acid-binding Zn ribbon protein